MVGTARSVTMTVISLASGTSIAIITGSAYQGIICTWALILGITDTVVVSILDGTA